MVVDRHLKKNKCRSWPIDWRANGYFLGSNQTETLAYGKGDTPYEVRLSVQSSEFQTAAFSACGTLAFITPEKAIPLLVGQIKEKLSPEVFAWISATDIQIWKAPEGAVVVDGDTPFRHF